jgi:DNA-binding transcriptional LysR family regulator
MFAKLHQQLQFSQFQLANLHIMDTALNAGPTLDWDDLRYALAIAEAGSLNGAAQCLGVRHTTVLRRLDALEQRLGARLFERRRQGYTPTDAGELMAAQAREMQPGIAEMQRRILGRDLQLQGQLRLNCAFIAMLYLLPEPLAAFARSHPGITVEVSENSTVVDLSRRDADVALRMSGEVPEHLVGRKLGEMRMRVYARRGAADLPQQVLPIERLCRDYRWIGYDSERTRRFFDRWMLDHVPPERIVMRMDLLHSAAAMARTGLGLALLPTLVEAFEPELVPVSDVLSDAGSPVWLLTHADLRHTARVRAFLQHVGTALAQMLARAP